MRISVGLGISIFIAPQKILMNREGWSHLFEWLLWKRQEITHVGKEAEKRECFYTVAGNVNGAVITENNLKGPQKIKNAATIWSSSSTSWCIMEVKVRTWTDVCEPMFLVILFIVAKTRKQSKCPSPRWLDKQISITYNYSAFKRKRIWYMLQHCWTLKTLSSVK